MKRKKVAVIGAGISGLTTAQLLKDKYDVTVFEKEDRPGGLIKCDRVNGSLFHTCGGHVLNSKYPEVLDWLKGFVNFDTEYVKANRNSSVVFDDGLCIPYPIENHVYLLSQDIQLRCIEDFLCVASKQNSNYANFEDFLKKRFGGTLFELYFEPYNKKVWRCPLNEIPLSWLDGKLPMPTVKEIFFNNMNHVEERNFVHSTFWYPKQDGSQFFADRLATGIDVQYGKSIDKLNFSEGVWEIDAGKYDIVVFCGNIKQLPDSIEGVDILKYKEGINALQYHGTTTVFCEINKNPYSWLYLPSSEYASHRIICTGNFSVTNNAPGKMTGTIEFTDEISVADIKDNLQKMPFSPCYITHKYNKYTYPIQTAGTKGMINEIKQVMCKNSFYVTGRFADWEYYNMDVAIKAAMKVCEKLL